MAQCLKGWTHAAEFLGLNLGSILVTCYMVLDLLNFSVTLKFCVSGFKK